MLNENRSFKSIEECNQAFKDEGYTDAQIQEINQAADNLIDIVLDKYFEDFLSD